MNYVLLIWAGRNPFMNTAAHLFEHRATYLRSGGACTRPRIERVWHQRIALQRLEAVEALVAEQRLASLA